MVVTWRGFPFTLDHCNQHASHQSLFRREEALEARIACQSETHRTEQGVRIQIPQFRGNLKHRDRQVQARNQHGKCSCATTLPTWQIHHTCNMKTRIRKDLDSNTPHVGVQWPTNRKLTQKAAIITLIHRTQAPNVPSKEINDFDPTSI